MTVRESILRYGASPWHRIDVYQPPQERVQSRVVLFHGGFWRHDRIARDLEPMAVALVGDGSAVAVVEYRPVWDGGWWPGAQDDCTAALDALAEQDAGWDTAVLAGHSAGAQLALAAVAGRSAGRRLVLLAPVVDLERAAALGVGGSAVPHLVSRHLAAGGRCADATPRPTAADLSALVVVEAAADQAVPTELVAEQLAQWSAAGLAPEHRVVPQARHMHLVNPERAAFTTVRELLIATAGPAS
ncbi:alpha/beta hydrolase [Kitasatospora sp. NPDC048540]|uniref:alpha/beta hydrolase n=1 Tax=Kitasatospora sp. NPDC048540 TaxID=3155634 RepID=UPI0033C15DD6